MTKHSISNQNGIILESKIDSWIMGGYLGMRQA